MIPLVFWTLQPSWLYNGKGVDYYYQAFGRFDCRSTAKSALTLKMRVTLRARLRIERKNGLLFVCARLSRATLVADPKLEQKSAQRLGRVAKSETHICGRCLYDVEPSNFQLPHVRRFLDPVCLPFCPPRDFLKFPLQISDEDIARDSPVSGRTHIKQLRPGRIGVLVVRSIFKDCPNLDPQ